MTPRAAQLAALAARIKAHFAAVAKHLAGK
jgi:hypothetical protein